LIDGGVQTGEDANEEEAQRREGILRGELTESAARGVSESKLRQGERGSGVELGEKKLRGMLGEGESYM